MNTPVLFQNMPPLSPDEYAALEASIRENGIQVPIIVDENGVVIDGHHRQKIASGLGITCPSRTVVDKTDTEKRTLALSLNLDRRHLSREQRRALIAASVKADPQLSDREHARRTGADHKTVGAIRGGLVAGGEIPHHETRVGADGIRQPATKPERIDPLTGEVLDGDREPSFADPAPEPLPKPTPEPSKPRRRPLTDAFSDGVYQLRLKVESLERLTRDDRFAANKEKAAQTDLHRLINTRDLLQQVIEQLS